MAEDTLNYDHCVEIAETVKKTYGRIDILVCAQGILIHKPIDVLTLDEWQKVVDVNMTSVFYSIKAVVPIMKELWANCIGIFHWRKKRTSGCWRKLL